MPSRRRVLASLGSAVAVGLAGCSTSASDGPETTDCRGNALSNGDGDVLGDVMATVDGEDVRLTIPLSAEAVDTQGVDELTIYDATGEVAYVIPVSPEDADVMANRPGVEDGQLQYEQHLGHRPFHGRYRITVVNGTGEQVDSITVEFNCFTDSDA